MLAKEQIPQRLESWTTIGEREALETAKQLSDWVYWMTRSCGSGGDDDCPFGIRNCDGVFCSEIGREFDGLSKALCWVAQEAAVAWLEAHDDHA